MPRVERGPGLVFLATGVLTPSSARRSESGALVATRRMMVQRPASIRLARAGPTCITRGAPASPTGTPQRVN